MVNIEKNDGYKNVKRQVYLDIVRDDSCTHHINSKMSFLLQMVITTNASLLEVRNTSTNAFISKLLFRRSFQSTLNSSSFHLIRSHTINLFSTFLL